MGLVHEDYPPPPSADGYAGAANSNGPYGGSGYRPAADGGGSGGVAAAESGMVWKGGALGEGWTAAVM